MAVEGNPMRAQYGITWGEGFCRDYRVHFDATFQPYGTPSERASLSRALRRLERRGLVRRHSSIITPGQRSTGRTHGVTLLPLGIEVAKRLTSKYEHQMLTVSCRGD